MNIVLLTNSYPYGDQEAFLEAEIKTLSEQFNEIHIYTFASPDAEWTRKVPDNVTVYRVKEDNDEKICPKDGLALFNWIFIKDCIFTKVRYGYSFRQSASIYLRNYSLARKRFLPYLLKENVENTIFYSYWFSHLSYALAYLKQIYPTAYCITRAHRFDNFIRFNACLMRNFILSKIDAVFPISLEGKKEIENRMLPFVKNLQCNIEVHHLGVNLPEICNPLSDSKKTLEIVSCSYIWKIKRLDILVDALAKINDLSIRWTHFGSGIDEAIVRKAATEKLGNKANIQYVFAGQVAHDEIIRYYSQQHVDLFVNCSDHEGIPVSIMEAMAAGIFCIARKVGGNGELIVNKKTGFLLDEQADSLDYVKAIYEYTKLTSHQLLQIRRAGIEKVKREFDSTRVYKYFCETLVQGMNERKINY